MISGVADEYQVRRRELIVDRKKLFIVVEKWDDISN